MEAICDGYIIKGGENPVEFQDRQYEHGEQGYSWGWTISMFLLIVTVIAFLTVPRYMRLRTGMTFYQCQSNCRNLGVALKMYYDENGEMYPLSLTTLIPDIMRIIPTCAASESNRGYIDSYQVSNDHKAYTFYCIGRYHMWVNVKKNYPQYTSSEGLKVRP